MSGLQEYKCPSCGGAMEFNSDIQKLKCPYCDSEYEISMFDTGAEQPESFPEESMTWEVSAGRDWEDGEADGLVTYVCKSCGGEIVGDSTTAATSCPYCDNPVVMKGQFSGSLKPDYVIPFKFDKKAAKEALMNHYGGKALLPKIFKDKNHIDEIKGIYVPFWLFDADAQADVRYNATRVRSWSDDDYDYTETSYYNVYRGGNLSFYAVPVDGSSKMADELMESVEPFDISEAVDFNTAYLAGYLADKYDIDDVQSVERANERIRQSVMDEFRSTVVGYATVNADMSSIRLQNGRAKYALYPVWILNTTYAGEKYTFAMNGQTGKFVGDLPMDKGLYTKYFAGLSAIVSVVAFAVQYLLY